MTTISIKIKGLDELKKNLSDLNVKQAFVDAANRSISEVQKLALVEVPKKTHQLAQSHILSPASLYSLKAEVYTEKEYAVPVHEGHRIVAWGHDTGRMQPANRWMERAATTAEPTIEKYFEQAVDKIANDITK
jgi:hypothetical protein